MNRLNFIPRSLSDLKLICCGNAGFGHIFRSFSFERAAMRLKRSKQSASNRLSPATISHFRQTPGPGSLLPLLRGWRKGLTLALMRALCLLLFSPAAHPALTQIVIFSSSPAPVYEQVAGQLKTHLIQQCSDMADQCGPLRVHLLTQQIDAAPVTIPSGTRLIVTLGQHAGELIHARNTGLPVLHALIPRSAYEQLPDGVNHSAVYLDQPINRQLKLARIVRPEPRIGVLISPLTKPVQERLAAASIIQDIPVTYRDVDSIDRVGPLLKEVLEESNILLALPDPTIFNRTTIFNILLSSYHNKVPVIGFSSAYVRAGALIAAYSTPEDIARHLAEAIRDFLHAGTGALPGPSYPKYFSVAVNRNVARSLGISLPDETDIIRQMLEANKP